MDPTRQIIRWSIPGAVLFLTLAIDEFVLAIGFRQVAPAASVFKEIDAGVGVFLVALGIPAGFLMNQIYYYIWDGMAVRFPWARVPGDRGRAILIEMDDRYVQSLLEAGLETDLSERIGQSSRRLAWVDALLGPRFQVLPIENMSAVDARRAYRDARKKNWRAVRWLMLFDLDDATSSVLRAEYGGRADAYHALGGSRYAIVTGTLLCFAYNLIVHFDGAIHHHAGQSVVVAVAWLVVMLAGYVLLTRGRAATYAVMQEVVRDALRASSRKQDPPVAVA